LAQLRQPCALKFSIQSASAKFPYRIRMVCGHIETRLLNLKTIGRYFDDDLVIRKFCVSRDTTIVGKLGRCQFLSEFIEGGLIEAIAGVDESSARNGRP
jgi:hypothetical protein